MDTYVQKLAQVLIRYSLNIQPGDILRITSGIAALPLIQEAFREAVRAGAHVMTHITEPTLEEIFLRH